ARNTLGRSPMNIYPHAAVPTTATSPPVGTLSGIRYDSVPAGASPSTHMHAHVPYDPNSSPRLRASRTVPSLSSLADLSAQRAVRREIVERSMTVPAVGMEKEEGG